MHTTKSTSLIVPHFNNPSTVGKVIESGLASGADELIVVDDGSNPSSRRALMRLVDGERVRLVRCPTNQGDGAARRVGILHAQNDILGFCDADLASISADGLAKLFQPVLSGKFDLAIGALCYQEGTEPRLNNYLAMPLLRQFAPELSGFVSSPLSGIRVTRREFVFPHRMDPRSCMMGMTLDAWHAGARICEVDIGLIENPKKPAAQKAFRADLILESALRRFEEWGLLAIHSTARNKKSLTFLPEVRRATALVNTASPTF